MTTTNTGGAGNQPTTGGAGGQPNSNPNEAIPGGAGEGEQNEDPPPPRDDKVARKDLDHALRDVQRYKEQGRQATAQLAEIRKEFDALKTKVAQDGNDYKQLYETEKERRNAAEMERDSLKANVGHVERYRAVFPELKKAGLLDAAENLLENADLSDIELEATTSGRFIAHGVKEFVEAFKAKHPYAFSVRRAPVVNGGGNRGTPSTGKVLTPGELFKLEQECKKKGDMAPYEAAHERYQQSKNAG